MNGQRHPSDYIALYQAQYRSDHREQNKDYSRNYYRANRELILVKAKLYYQTNKDRIIRRNNDWLRQNPEKSRSYKRKWKKGSSPAAFKFRVDSSLRSRLRKLVRSSYKSAPMLRLLGCSIESFKIYLESKFAPSMSWQNYGAGSGKWQIDHIMPCAIFDLTKPEHQKRCFHFSNMQPLWWKENSAKSDKVLSNQFQLL